MKRKLIGTLFIIVFTFSSVFIATNTFSITQNVRDDEISSNSLDSEENKEMISESSNSWNFYAEIGRIYETKTSDGVIIRILRYHAPGKNFNYGTQPILLFPGLMANINEYISFTTPAVASHYDVPSIPDAFLAEWAKGDKNIEEDSLLYFSLAYYLWSQGYDPWLANYRGVGYGPMKSGGMLPSVTMDDFAIYDIPAAVRKVYEITGQHPYIGGHSTGGFTSIIYLQGCKYDRNGGVYSSSSAVAERNGDREGPETVKGFIGLEHAWIPSITDIMDNLLVWAILDMNTLTDMRSLAEILTAMQEMPTIGDLIRGLVDLMLGALADEIESLMLNLMNMDIRNINKIWLYFFTAYVIDTLYYRAMAQYLDFDKYGIVREYWQNGWFNNHISPPRPHRFDGYYYYSDEDNIRKFKVPAIFFFASHQSASFDLVNRDLAIRDVANRKSNRGNDVIYIINGAHIDFCTGNRAPGDVFPKLGLWLESLEGQPH
ncbi:MAG: alpha/beta hydrolase [Promethearchaeota archaeon]